MKARADYLPLSLVVTLFLMSSVLGQTTHHPSSAENEEEKSARLYKQFVEIHRKNAAAALTLATEYLEMCAVENARSKFVKTWVSNYKKDLLRFHVKRLIEEKRFDEAFERGRAILSSHPNDFDTLFTLNEGGLLALAHGNKTVAAEAIAAARKALELIETDPSVILEKEPEVAAGLNFSLGIFLLISSPADAIAHFNKFAQCEPCVKNPLNYSRLADAIWKAEYSPLQTEFASRFKTPEQRASPEAEPLKLRLFWTADVIVDALARAVALADSDPRFSAQKASWLSMLRDAYRSRNSGYETGLSELIEQVLDEPFPRQPI